MNLPEKAAFWIQQNGGCQGNRTPNHQIKNLELYQLS